MALQEDSCPEGELDVQHGDEVVLCACERIKWQGEEVYKDSQAVEGIPGTRSSEAFLKY